MLRTWVSAVFAGALTVAANQTVTIDDLDSSIVLSPLNSWAWSNQGGGAFHGTFSFSDDIDATVRFTFPQPATGVSWQGFKRSGAALYSICIDCSGPNDPNYELVDGHESNASPNEPVTALFSKQGLSRNIHNVTIKNLLDSRFLAASQVTLDGFILTTSDNDTSSAPNPPASTSMPAGPSNTGSNAGSPTAASKAAVHSTTKTPIFIGALAAGGSILLLAAIGLLCWRRRRTAYSSLNNSNNGDVSPMMRTLETMPLDVEAHNMMTSSEGRPYSDTASALYQQFPAPPENHPTTDVHVFHNIPSETQPRGPHGPYKHSASESTSSMEPLLFTTNSRRPASSTKTADYIPIALSNPFTNSASETATEESHLATPLEESSDVGQWYPSSIFSEYWTNPRPKKLLNVQKPMAALDRSHRGARPVSSATSVFPSASLRVSVIVDAMRDVMTPRSKTGSPQLVQEISTTRRPPEGPPPRQLSPPRTGGHSRSPSSSPLFF